MNPKYGLTNIKIPSWNLKVVTKVTYSCLPRSKQTVFPIYSCLQIVFGAILCQYTSINNSLDNLKPITFISVNFSGTECDYAAYIRETFAIYLCVKGLSFYLQDVKCIIPCDHKPMEKFLKGKVENDKVNNLSINLNKWKFNIHSIRATKNILADCIKACWCKCN